MMMVCGYGLIYGPFWVGCYRSYLFWCG